MSEPILDDFETPSETGNEKYFLAYFGRQQEYYITRYREFQSGKKFTFNVGSFFLGLFWLLYRKLFLQFVVVLCVLFASSFVESFIYELLQVSTYTQSMINVGMNIVWLIPFGFGGNYLYLKQAEKNVDRILSSTTDEDERVALLSKKGGTSNAPYYAIVALMIFYFLLS